MSFFPGDVQEVQKLSKKVVLTSSVIQLMKEFRHYLRKQNMYVSDRRWRKIVKLLRVSAFTNNQHETNIYDVWLVPHCLWERPEQFDAINEFYKKRIFIDGDFSLEKLTSMINRWSHGLNTDKNKYLQATSSNGKPLYIDSNGKTTEQASVEKQKQDKRGKFIYKDGDGKETTEKQSYYSGEHKQVIITVNNSPHLIPVKYSQAHIDSRISQISLLSKDINSFHERLVVQHSSAKSVLDDHLWADESLLPEISQSLTQAIEQVSSLQKRVEKIISDFKKLPLEDISEAMLSSPHPIEEQDEEAVEGELID